MVTGLKRLTKQERQAREAIDAMEDDDIWLVGQYTTNHAGRAVRATMPKDFCDEHNIESGDTLNAFVHTGSGALVILPAEDTDE